MRAISVFSLEAGTSTLGWRAWIALRTRVSMSAMGSLVIVLLLPPPRLPACLDHARNLAIQGELAETQPADAELAQECPRAPAAPAAVAVAAPQLGRLCQPGLFQFLVSSHLGGCGHSLPLSSAATAGTAFPSAAATPRPPHRCGPSW